MQSLDLQLEAGTRGQGSLTKGSILVAKGAKMTVL